MNVSLSNWLVIALALIGANLPFLNERLFGMIPAGVFGKGGIKPFWVRLIELFVFYALVGLLANFLEGRIGNVFPQGWEFYAVTGSLFLVLAYPGFVFRYLRKRRG